MEKLFIVHRAQFGYHTDIYKWCEYLHDSYYINLLCFNDGKTKYRMDNVDVHYVYGKGWKIVRWLCFLMMCFIHLSLFKGIIIVSHFSESRLLKRIMPWKKMILDIRTFSVHPDENVRKTENAKLFKSVALYDYVTVISDGLRKQLPKESDKTAVLPLGGDVIDLPSKKYDRLDLLYIGTFYNRCLENTIQGFSIAKKQLKDVKIVYHIVGNGTHGEDEMLKSLCKELNIENDVIFYGRQPHNELIRFFEKCNIGVSYVPIVPYYEYQPVTKTFEYIMAGLYTIATATKCNVEVINENNGCLIEDNANSFADAIIKTAQSRYCINDAIVRKSLEEYDWRTIVNNKMKPILHDVYEKIYS